MKLDEFFQSVNAASESLLLLDFDGTLAPFRVDPSKVRPWAGIVNLLDKIQQAGRTRLAIITGRPAGDVASQLGMDNAPEIWGLHGAERLYPDGRLEEEELIADEQALLEAARSAVREARLGVRVEEKRNAVVVHWRGKSPHSIHAARSRALKLLRPFADNPAMKLLQFDGGLELRAGRDKGDAVRMILVEVPNSTPVAYLGDDATDEDAFLALAGRGLGVLVRREWRPGAAQMWLRPPAQLREFLAAWLRATQG
jgi:trehalose-phosphatase